MIGYYDLRLTNFITNFAQLSYMLKLLPVIGSNLTFGPLNELCVVFVKFARASHFAVLFYKFVEINNNRRNADL